MNLALVNVNINQLRICSNSLCGQNLVWVSRLKSLGQTWCTVSHVSVNFSPLMQGLADRAWARRMHRQQLRFQQTWGKKRRLSSALSILSNQSNVMTPQSFSANSSAAFVQKLHCHWLKSLLQCKQHYHWLHDLWQCHVTLVIQGWGS